jgi:hypothetical protein
MYEQFLGVPSTSSPTDLERYKAIALAAGKQGRTPGQVREMIKQQIVTDLKQHAANTGVAFHQHLATLKAQTTPTSGVGDTTGVGGFDLFREISKATNDVAKATRDVEHVANDVIKKVGPAVNAIAKFAGNIPWGEIVHDVQAAISTIPGLGTVVSEAIAFGESAYDSAVALAHHNPIEAAIDAAYNGALAAVPGASALRHILDPVKATILGLVSGAMKHESVADTVLDGILRNVPDKPSFGKINPRGVAGSLAHLIVKHVGVKKGGPHAAPPPVVSHAAPPPAVHAAAPPPVVPHPEHGRVPPPPAAPPVAPPRERYGHRPRAAAQGKYAPYPR